MSEFSPVETLADLSQLDSDEIVAGYRAGTLGCALPGSDKSRAYWHGWRNGMADFGHMKSDSAMQKLVEEFVRKQRAH